MALKPRKQTVVAMDRSLAHGVAMRRERLNRAARREPTAVLGVLFYWLAPQTGEGEKRADN